MRDLDKLKKVPDDYEIALRALTWLLYSTQPLRLSHLATAAAIDPDCVFSDDQRLDQNENIFDVCRSLILVHVETDVVDFYHFSVREFLQLPRLSDGSDNPYYCSVIKGNALLLKACFMYLASQPFVSPVSHLTHYSDILQQLKAKFRDQFTFYAVYEWPNHAAKLESSGTTDSVKFLTGDSFSAWREVWELSAIRDRRWWEGSEDRSTEVGLWSEAMVCDLRTRSRSTPGSALYYASALGLRSIADELLSKGHDPNEFGGPEAYPLFVALRTGNLALAEWLLSKGANINIVDQRTKDTALHCAIKKRDKEGVKFLLDRNADHKAYNERELPPLHLAMHMDGEGEVWYSEIIELLAQVDVNVKDRRGRTAVHFAAKVGCFLSTSLLLQQGADVHVTDDDGRTPLHAASLSGASQIVDMLLNTQANIGITDALGYTAMHMAVQAGHTEIVKKLFQMSGNPVDSFLQPVCTIWGD